MSDEEKWAVLVQEFRSSRKSQRVWCTENGIKRSTLRYWLERTDIISLGTEIKFSELVIEGETE